MQNDGCANCGMSLSPGYDYCPRCGQAAHIHRINLRFLLHELVHFFTHADKGIFFLVKELAFRPGVVAREYIGGRRKKYFSPLSFFFIVIGLFVLTLTFFHTFQKPGNFEAARIEVRQIRDEVSRERKLAKIDRAEKATRFMEKYSNFVSMLATPIAAFIFLLFYPRRTYNFSEHLVAHLYFAGFGGIVFIFLFAPLLSVLPMYLYLPGIFLYLLFTLVYRAVAYYQLMERKGILHFLHALAASMVSVLSWVVLSRGIIQHYIEKGF